MYRGPSGSHQGTHSPNDFDLPGPPDAESIALKDLVECRQVDFGVLRSERPIEFSTLSSKWFYRQHKAPQAATSRSSTSDASSGVACLVTVTHRSRASPTWGRHRTNAENMLSSPRLASIPPSDGAVSIFPKEMTSFSHSSLRRCGDCEASPGHARRSLLAFIFSFSDGMQGVTFFILQMPSL